MLVRWATKVYERHSVPTLAFHEDASGKFLQHASRLAKFMLMLLLVAAAAAVRTPEPHFSHPR